MSARSNFRNLAPARPRAIEQLESRRLLSGGRSHHLREVIELAITTIVQQIEVPLETPTVATPVVDTPPVETPLTEAPLVEAPIEPAVTPTPEVIEPPVGEVIPPIEGVLPETPEVVDVEPIDGEVVAPVGPIDPVGEVLPDIGAGIGGEVVEVIDVTPVVPEVPVTEVEVVIPGLDNGEVATGFDPGSDTGVIDDIPAADDSVFGEEPIGDGVEVVEAGTIDDQDGNLGDDISGADSEPTEVITTAPPVIVEPVQPVIATTITPPPIRQTFSATIWQQREATIKTQMPSQQIATQKPVQEVMPTVTLVQSEVRVAVNAAPISNEPTSAQVETKSTETQKVASAQSASAQEASANESTANVAVVIAPAVSVATPAPAQQTDTPVAETVVEVQTVVHGDEVLLTNEGHPVLGKLLKNGYGRVAGSDDEPPKKKTERAPRIIKQEVVEDEKVAETVTVTEPVAMQAELAANTEASEQVAAATATEAVALAIPVPMQEPESPEQLPPPVAASMVTPVDSASSTVRNIVAALAVGTAVGVVQLHQWRKRKMAEAASKLASLLSFDPLAVWLDEDDRQRR